METELLNNIYDDITLGDNLAAKNHIDSLLKTKILNAIDSQKTNVAQSLFHPILQDDESQEQYDIEEVEESLNLHNIFNQSSKQSSSMNVSLKNGATISVDPISSKIMVEYLQTLKNDVERNVFLTNMINNERTFLKMFDIAKQRIQ